MYTRKLSAGYGRNFNVFPTKNRSACVGNGLTDQNKGQGGGYNRITSTTPPAMTDRLQTAEMPWSLENSRRMK